VIEIDTKSVHSVLADLHFPAQRWEILISADIYGADSGTLDRLRGLPVRRAPYHDLREVLEALDAISAQHISSALRPTHRPER
jgi:hypothetical protein